MVLRLAWPLWLWCACSPALAGSAHPPLPLEPIRPPDRYVLVMFKDMAERYHQIAPSTKVVVFPYGLRVSADGQDAVLGLHVMRRGVRGKTCLIGKFRAAVIVNRANDVKQLTTSRIGSLFSGRGSGARWRQLGGTGGAVRCYGVTRKSKAVALLRQKCMRFIKRDKDGWYGGWYAFGKEVVRCANDDDVIAKVRADRNGLGFVLYRGQAFRGTRMVPVAPAEGAAGALPDASMDGDGQTRYALSEPILVSMPSNAGGRAKDFVTFSLGPVGARIADEHGLLTQWRRLVLEGRSRLRSMKAGKGIRLSACGAGVSPSAFSELAVEFVRAKEVIQPALATMSTDVAAIGAFTGGAGERELLVLGDRPGDRALRVHGARWNELQPAEHLPAGRAAG